jgi:predicted RNA-binding protein YlxR (DUF448 family)
MTADGSGQPGRVPARQCVACRQLVPRPALVRLVRQPDGEVALDEGQRLNGRGAYVCREAGCVQAATRRGAFQKALRRGVASEVLAHLLALVTPPTPPPVDGATTSTPGERLSPADR